MTLSSAIIRSALALLLCQVTATAQNSDSGVWTALFSRGDFSSDNERLKWWFDGHVRTFGDTDGFGQSIVRPGLGYRFGEDATVWAGYGWIRNQPATRAPFDEHRLWQQVTWTESCDWLRIGFRSRLEQRFVGIGSDTGLRYRQLVSWRQPLGSESPFTFVVWDEIFAHLNDTDWGARGGYDQNRLFVGIGFRKSTDSPSRLEVGYLNQHIDRHSRDDLHNHLLSLNYFYSP